MKQSNFTDNEILSVIKTLSPRLNVRINKAGNITVADPKEKVLNIHQLAAAWTQNYPDWKEYRGWWTLYNIGNGKCLWRRHSGYGPVYPLNMRGRERIGEIHKEEYDGKVYTWYDREEYTIENSYFNSVKEALSYFKKYLKKYRNINI